MTTIVIGVLGFLVFYLNIKLRQANETIAELRSVRADHPGEYRLTIRPEAFQHYENHRQPATTTVT